MKNTGFTLLFSLLVAVTVLSVSLGIYNIVIRQLAISGIGSDSQKAFYIADAGMECALYWDLKKQAFDTEDYNIKCLGDDISGSLMASTTSFRLNLIDGSCANVFIDKSSGIAIKSNGYNVDCDSSGSRKVERVLEIGG